MKVMPEGPAQHGRHLADDPEDLTRTEEGREAIRAQVQRIVASAHFSHSKRYPQLLQYLVQVSLDGRADSLKERTVGVEVFHRSPDYDTNGDPVVRVTAAEVRKRLALYYDDYLNREELRIEIPIGSYVPNFIPVPAAARSRPVSGRAEPWPAQIIETVPLEAPAPSAPVAPATGRKTTFVWAVLLLLGLTVGIGLLIVHHRQAVVRDELTTLWRPMLDEEIPLLITVGQPSTIASPETMPDNHPLTATEHLRTADSVVFSDVQSLSRIMSFLASQKRTWKLQSAKSTTFDDLRQHSTILVGGFDNPWTQRAIRSLRFTMVRNPGYPQFSIVDAKDPKNRWSVDFSQPYTQVSEDYAIVARFRDSESQRLVLVVAGVGENGTKAASEFVTEVAKGTQRLPKSDGIFNAANFEIVLSTRVVNGISGPPQIVASYTWD